MAFAAAACTPDVAQPWVAIALVAAITVASGMELAGVTGVADIGPTASAPVGVQAPSVTFGFADEAAATDGSRLLDVSSLSSSRRRAIDVRSHRDPDEP